MFENTWSWTVSRSLSWQKKQRCPKCCSQVKILFMIGMHRRQNLKIHVYVVFGHKSDTTPLLINWAGQMQAQLIKYLQLSWGRGWRVTPGKGTLFKWVYVWLSHERQGWWQGFMVAWVCAATPCPQKKLLLGSLVKIAFPRLLLFTTITDVWDTSFCFTCRLKIEVALSVRQSLLVGANVTLKGKISANSWTVSKANYLLSNAFEDLFKALNFDKPFEWFEYPFRQLQHPFKRFLGGVGETPR